MGDYRRIRNRRLEYWTPRQGKGATSGPKNNRHVTRGLRSRASRQMAEKKVLTIVSTLCFTPRSLIFCRRASAKQPNRNRQYITCKCERFKKIIERILGAAASIMAVVTPSSKSQ